MNQALYMTIPRLAEQLGVSRTAVYKRVKSGKIAADRLGRTYAIPIDEAEAVLSGGLTIDDKNFVRAVVELAVKDYGPVFEWLSRA